jgi:type IV pilus assembly protein PilA
MKTTKNGFTLIELMIVIAIIGILTLMAMPSYQNRIIQSQIEEALQLSKIAQTAISDYYKKTERFPENNRKAGLPQPNKIIGNYVQELEVINGTINIVLGNRVNKYVLGKRLTIRPAVVSDEKIVPIAWVCGNASSPQGMDVIGKNATDLESYHLPLDCRY